MYILYERVDRSNILSCFVVGRPGPEYGLPVAIIRSYGTKVPTAEPPVAGLTGTLGTKGGGFLPF